MVALGRENFWEEGSLRSFQRNSYGFFVAFRNMAVLCWRFYGGYTFKGVWGFRSNCTPQRSNCTPRLRYLHPSLLHLAHTHRSCTPLMLRDTPALWKVFSAGAQAFKIDLILRPLPAATYDSLHPGPGEGSQSHLDRSLTQPRALHDTTNRRETSKTVLVRVVRQTKQHQVF